MQGGLCRVTEAVLRLLPRLLSQRLLALGSPVSETCHLGFVPGITGTEKLRLLCILLRKLEEIAGARRVQIVAAKDAASAQDELWAEAGQHDGQRLLDKFLGMDYAIAHRYNLYFYTWIGNVRYCIAHGIAL